MRTAERTHEFCYGHRVYKHESKCSNFHGHAGKVKFVLQSEQLDEVGRILDFGEIGRLLCNWLETYWDHKFLIWQEDPKAKALKHLDETVTLVPFNPTAENLAEYLVTTMGPKQLSGTGCTLTSCEFWETGKCCATYSLYENYSNFEKAVVRKFIGAGRG